MKLTNKELRNIPAIKVSEERLLTIFEPQIKNMAFHYGSRAMGVAGGEHSDLIAEFNIRCIESYRYFVKRYSDELANKTALDIVKFTSRKIKHRAIDLSRKQLVKYEPESRIFSSYQKENEEVQENEIPLKLLNKYADHPIHGITTYSSVSFWKSTLTPLQNRIIEIGLLFPKKIKANANLQEFLIFVSKKIPNLSAEEVSHSLLGIPNLSEIGLNFAHNLSNASTNLRFYPKAILPKRRLKMVKNANEKKTYQKQTLKNKVIAVAKYLGKIEKSKIITENLGIQNAQLQFWKKKFGDRIEKIVGQLKLTSDRDSIDFLYNYQLFCNTINKWDDKAIQNMLTTGIFAANAPIEAYEISDTREDSPVQFDPSEAPEPPESEVMRMLKAEPTEIFTCPPVMVEAIPEIALINSAFTTLQNAIGKMSVDYCDYTLTLMQKNKEISQIKQQLETQQKQIESIRKLIISDQAQI